MSSCAVSARSISVTTASGQPAVADLHARFERMRPGFEVGALARCQ